MTPEEEQTPAGPKSPRVRFHYLKSPFFRTIHVDGAHGGPTPRGHIQVAFFSERQAIPQQIEHYLTKDGKLGEEIEESRVSREGMVRELEVNVMMTLETAKSIRGWLDKHIENLQAQFKKASEK